ncbi:class II glutamine amidotransferase [Solirubrobacter soli]|uniref:class II glutamine amidotransferase n=1 Tax=Solirubrobacter soli TaxID=363832 RepID=UPI00041D160C|nr:class II glutamine amidotransferase [Solirubrobacter soli]
MCRWNAYYGQPLMLEELLFETDHGLIDQSKHARQGVETTNGDGFGVGWYTPDTFLPGRYRSEAPAWNDPNLRDLAAHIASPLFLAHIRAATGTPVQQTNCHPFRHGRWLFVHNGSIHDFHKIRRELLLRVDPMLFEGIHGSTDSEVLFYLALTFGLESTDPISAVEKAVGFIEATGRAHGIENPVQMTLGFSNGEKLWAVRYSSERASRTLYVSADRETVQALHPDNPRFQRMTNEDRVVVSEPLSDLPGVWRAVPEATALVIQPGPDELREFRPQAPAPTVLAEAG